jgi:phage major head subunit gpT-like protein
MANRAVTIKGIRGEFLAGIEAAPRLHTNIAQVVDSDAPEETYLYGGQVPRMEEWLDTRKAVDLFQKKLTVPNKIYANAIKADRFEKQDDRLGFFNQRIREMGTEASNFVDELVFGTLLDAAESATGSEGPAYDGQAFFDTDHVDPAAEYTTAQSNDLGASAVAPTNPTLAEFDTSVKANLLAMRTFRDDRGRKWWRNIGPSTTFWLIVPPEMEVVATKFIKSMSTDTTNPAIVNALTNITNYALIVNTETANDDSYIQALAAPGRMPFLVQQRVRPVMNSVTGDRAGEIDSETFFNRYDFWGAYNRVGIGYGQWRSAILTRFA